MSPQAARKLIRVIIEEGVVEFSPHVRKPMKKRGVSAAEVERCLQSGTVDPPEAENGSWRYRVRAFALAVVVPFSTETNLMIVTVIR